MTQLTFRATFMWLPALAMMVLSLKNLNAQTVSSPDISIQLGSKFSSDFNGDGVGDIAVGIPNEDIGDISAAGAVQVIYGRKGDCPSSIASSQFWHQNSSGIGEECEEGDLFGSALAVGDFNKDGFDDLAIGAPGENQEISNLSILTAVGTVHILFGSASGLTSQNSELWNWDDFSVLRPQDHSFFGQVLVSGDFDSDGFDDLAIGAPLMSPEVPPLGQNNQRNEGVVFTLYGSSGGLTALGNQVMWSQIQLHCCTGANDHFGTALAAGDFNNDGFADLAVGAPFDNLNGASPSVVDDAGQVDIIYGSSAGLTSAGSQALSQNSPGVLGGAERHDHFGVSLTVGDFDSDGYTDLAVGVPDEDVDNIENAGAVNVFYGFSDGLRTQGGQIWHQNSPDILGGAEHQDRFGLVLSSGDLNDDNYSDLIIGVQNESIGSIQNAGVFHVIYGSPAHLSAFNNQQWHQDQPSIFRGVETDDRFGAALSSGDFDGDGHADVFVGTPGESFSGTNQAGALLILFGSSGILTSRRHQFLSQSSPGIPDNIEKEDQFCSGVAIGKYIQGIGLSIFNPESTDFDLSEKEP